MRNSYRERQKKNNPQILLGILTALPLRNYELCFKSAFKIYSFINEINTDIGAKYICKQELEYLS